jgi:16S rRNA (guanine966-N2)-methyltransferase
LKANAQHQPSTARAGSEVRIIGGLWKRSKLPVLDKPGLRPTPDRVRETLFNWLGQDLTGWRVLDAFAGTGALGMEAASRGAGEVLLIEQDPQAAKQLQTNAQRFKATQVQVRQGDALALMQAMPAQSWDLVFLDPPYAANCFAAALGAASRIVQEAGAVYLEANRPLQAEWLQGTGLGLYRELKAGAVHAHLLAPSPPA